MALDPIQDMHIIIKQTLNNSTAHLLNDPWWNQDQTTYPLNKYIVYSPPAFHTNLSIPFVPFSQVNCLGAYRMKSQS